MDSPRITYTPPEGELNALSAIYQRAIERYKEANEGGPATAPEDAAKEIKNGCDAEPIIPGG